MSCNCNSDMHVRIKRLSEKAKLPEYAMPGDCCFDLSSIEDVVILPGQFKVVKTGLSFEVPEGYVMNVYSRSGIAFKNQCTLINSVGVIDSGYRGEVNIGIKNLGDSLLEVKTGMRIAQAEIRRFIKCSFEVVDELSDTERGESGFGSTGR